MARENNKKMGGKSFLVLVLGRLYSLLLTNAINLKFAADGLMSK
jgi:hypothetical protein